MKYDDPARRSVFFLGPKTTIFMPYFTCIISFTSIIIFQLGQITLFLFFLPIATFS